MRHFKPVFDVFSRGCTDIGSVPRPRALRDEKNVPCVCGGYIRYRQLSNDQFVGNECRIRGLTGTWDEVGPNSLASGPRIES